MIINFFNTSDGTLDQCAINAGIYIFELSRTADENSPHFPLYIGESVWVATRCSTHLFKVSKKPAYFGFTEKNLCNNKLTLTVRVLQTEKDTAARKQLEKEFIKELKPLTQSGSSDRMSPMEEKITKVQNIIINELNIED